MVYKSKHSCIGYVPIASGDIIFDAPSHVKSLLLDFNLDPDRFVDVMLGCEWIKDQATQVYIVDFLDQLRAHRNALLLQSGPILPN